MAATTTTPCINPSVAVFDFDGTLTEPWPVEKAFTTSFLNALSDALGHSFQTLHESFQTVLADEAQRPSWSLDFLVDTLPMVRAHADPWLLTSVRMKELTRRLGLEDSVSDPLLREIFRVVYPRHPATFRPELQDYFQELQDHGCRLFVITNSPGVHVSERLEALGFQGPRAITVLGGAQKFRPAPASHARAVAWQTKLPKDLLLPGARRVLALHRGFYLDALAQVCEVCACEPDALLVTGDIFELDLVLPLLLGARVHHVVHAGAAPFELDFLRTHAHATQGPGLRPPRFSTR